MFQVAKLDFRQFRPRGHNLSYKSIFLVRVQSKSKKFNYGNFSVKSAQKNCVCATNLCNRLAIYTFFRKKCREHPPGIFIVMNY